MYRVSVGSSALGPLSSFFATMLLLLLLLNLHLLPFIPCQCPEALTGPPFNQLRAQHTYTYLCRWVFALLLHTTALSCIRHTFSHATSRTHPALSCFHAGPRAQGPAPLAVARGIISLRRLFVYSNLYAAGCAVLHRRRLFKCVAAIIVNGSIVADRLENSFSVPAAHFHGISLIPLPSRHARRIRRMIPRGSVDFHFRRGRKGAGRRIEDTRRCYRRT